MSIIVSWWCCCTRAGSPVFLEERTREFCTRRHHLSCYQDIAHFQKIYKPTKLNRVFLEGWKGNVWNQNLSWWRKGLRLTLIDKIATYWKEGGLESPIPTVLGIGGWRSDAADMTDCWSSLPVSDTLLVSDVTS